MGSQTVHQRSGKGKIESQNVRRKILKDDFGRERTRPAECVLNRNSRVLGMCTGAFLGLFWEPVNSGMNHAQGEASPDKQQTSWSA